MISDLGNSIFINLGTSMSEFDDGSLVNALLALYVCLYDLM